MGCCSRLYLPWLIWECRKSRKFIYVYQVVVQHWLVWLKQMVPHQNAQKEVDYLATSSELTYRTKQSDCVFIHQLWFRV